MQVSTATREKPDCQDGVDTDRLAMVRSSITPVDEAADLGDLFKLLGDPTRLRILSSLIEAGELSVGAIAEVVDTNETKVSQALRLLRNAGVVKNRRSGRTIFYRLNDAHVRLILGLSLEHVHRNAAENLPRIGTAELVSVAGASGEPLTAVAEVVAITGVGLAGDRHAGNAARQVSIQSLSELAAASERLGRPISADQTRRNITIDAGELPRERGQRLFLGDAELEVFSDAPPCELMTEIIGKGARRALKKLAGIHCRVINGGVIRVGDELLLGRPAA